MADSLPDVFRGAPTYAQIRELEQAIARLPAVECPLTHHFAYGVYGREMFAAAGTVLTGKMHRMATLNILLQGRVRVTAADGAVQEMVAPHVYVTPPGCKKVFLVLEDIRWLITLPTKLTDLAAIEAKFILPESPAITQE